MSETVIKVERLSKRYRLGTIGGKTLREDVSRWWAKLHGKPNPLLKVDQVEKNSSRDQQAKSSTPSATSTPSTGSLNPSTPSTPSTSESPDSSPGSLTPSPSSTISTASTPDDHIWALKNINVEVKRGEILGIIGRNGAGKSTLLKIISRITAPTSGEIKIKGRIGSLLEVGTGFHPELTGRENTYLNGAILGMTKAQVNQEFDEIVAFAELEKFIDTPVKRYSSGMYVRLAFAVAAHLEPEILVVDEVLAVGDAGFQKKCLGKMGDVSKEGRTVLFVSHNMVAVQSLCQKVMLLDKGELVQNGPANQIVSNYLKYTLSSTQMDQVWENKDEAPGCEEVRLHRISIQTNDQDNNIITMMTPFLIIVEYWNEIPAACLHITLHIRNEQGIVAFTTGSSQVPGWNGQSLEKGLYRSACQMPKNLLNSGRHSITILIVRNLSNVIYVREDALVFDVVDNRDRSGGWFGKEPGVVQPYLDWKTEYLGFQIQS